MQHGQGTETDSNGNICREDQWINGIINSDACIDDDLYDDEIAKLGKRLIPALSLKIDEGMDNDDADDDVSDEMLM
jgi:hypothetical protein